MNLISMFDESASRWPAKTLLHYGDQTFSYAGIQALSLRAAQVLREHGVGQGDRVALMCFNTPYFLVAVLGALRLGAVIVPVNHKLQKPEVEFVLRHSGARLCIFDGALSELASRLETPALLLSTGESPRKQDAAFDHFDTQVERTEPGEMPPLVADDALAQVLYTSGTTGQPKGCLHSHRNVFTTALICSAALSMTHNDRMLIAMPIWHAAPLNNWSFGTLLMGGTLVFLREYTPRGFLESISKYGITLTFGAPIALLAPLELADFESHDLSAMRLWIYGGGPLGEEMARRLMERYRSTQFMQVYGMTEMGPLGTALFPEDALRKAGSIGRSSLPGVQVRVVAGDGGDTPAGRIGEIQLRSEAGMLGYLGDPQATAAAYTADGWYRSGDLARVDEDGYYYVVDRLKDLITTGGENVYSKEVEDALSPHPDVADVAVIGRAHPQWGETVVAVVVARPGRQPDPDALKAFLADKLARYKIPRDYVFVDTLPRTPSGKLQKHLLRTSVAGTPAGLPLSNPKDIHA
ncbi:class I adenylate-forming enzyme family protein [Variovorax saccharolyticus]|uniref:class I adenylate-forming enzyme family protein n=1 Tax=Variovorax saccharolyticus TaxID=3053516 RepID=UPI002578149B|nr:AMP-binding protein [Variovorax sp. J31P216]MDM0029292.1 AMP-binding protein [Variovorax sp. J31P216]